MAAGVEVMTVVDVPTKQAVLGIARTMVASSNPNPISSALRMKDHPHGLSHRLCTSFPMVGKRTAQLDL